MKEIYIGNIGNSIREHFESKYGKSTNLGSKHNQQFPNKIVLSLFESVFSFQEASIFFQQFNSP
jgi:hypothetical protein